MYKMHYHLLRYWFKLREHSQDVLNMKYIVSKINRVHLSRYKFLKMRLHFKLIEHINTWISGETLVKIFLHQDQQLQYCKTNYDIYQVNYSKKLIAILYLTVFEAYTIHQNRLRPLFFSYINNSMMYNYINHILF